VGDTVHMPAGEPVELGAGALLGDAVPLPVP
jgi:hypothetical protein